MTAFPETSPSSLLVTLKPAEPSKGSDKLSEEEQSTALICAKVWCEVGEIDSAEREVAAILENEIDNLDALNLYAKIKHIKGELSQAIACWAQLHVQAPHNETARMFLISIMHLAQNPERAAGEFVALGHYGAKLSTLTLMELEKAFRLFLTRQYSNAQSVCDALALRSKAKNPRAYKLAVLAKAWIAELATDFDGAVETLENLGQQPGMETDIDRVLALARIYEQQGSQESLVKAAHICRYLIRSYAKMSAMIRLAAIHKRLGKGSESKIYEEQFYQAFCQRMFIPSLDELALAASLTYIPLKKLKQARHSPGDRPVSLTERGQALRSWLEQEPKTAFGYFLANHEQPIDLQYRIDFLIQEEEDVYAYRLASERWTGTELHPQLLQWMLQYALDHDAATIRQKIQQKGLTTVVIPFLEGALRLDPRDPVASSCLAMFYELSGDADISQKYYERATAFQAARLKTRQCVGRALAAAVYNFTGKKKGIIHELWADRTSTETGTGGDLPDSQILGNLTEESRGAVKNIFLAVREYARAKFPHLTGDIQDYSYLYKVTKEDEASGGQSIGLPTALAFLSVFLQKPIPQNFASSGIIIAESHQALVIRRIGDVSYKVKAAFNRNLKRLLLPAENKTELQQLGEVPAPISESLVEFAMGFDEAVAACFGNDIWLH